MFVDLKPLGRPPTLVGSHPKSVFLFGDEQLDQTGHFHAPDTYVKCSLLRAGGVQSFIGGQLPVPSPPEDGRERGHEMANINERLHP